MKRIHFNRPNNLILLHDELMVKMPALAPIEDGEGISRPIIRVEGEGDDIWLTVPDDADEVAIGAVVQSHDATMLPPNTRRDQSTRISELLDIPRSQWTSAQMRELISLTAQILR